VPLLRASQQGIEGGRGAESKTLERGGEGGDEDSLAQIDSGGKRYSSDSGNLETREKKESEKEHDGDTTNGTPGERL